jgi:ribose-phosphate pyrophosphokinase
MGEEMASDKRDLMIFSGQSNPKLAEKISKALKLPLGLLQLSRFRDGEINFQIQENVRGRDVFLIQSTCKSHGQFFSHSEAFHQFQSVNDNLVELLVMIDAFKRASVKRLTAVMPYFGYARQDRKDKPRVPISAKLVAELLQTAGADRVLTLDLHTNQLQGFFGIPVDHLYAGPVMLPRLRQITGDIVVVSPDAGGVERARGLAKRLNNASLAIIDKRRTQANISRVMHIIGDVKGRDCIIVDDILDTGGTLTQCAQALVDNGANRVYAAISHAVLSDPALERIHESVLEKVFVTDSIPLPEAGENSPKIEVVSVAEMIGEAINRIYLETSISTLF